MFVLPYSCRKYFFIVKRDTSEDDDTKNFKNKDWPWQQLTGTALLHAILTHEGIQALATEVIERPVPPQIGIECGAVLLTPAVVRLPRAPGWGGDGSSIGPDPGIFLRGIAGCADANVNHTWGRKGQCGR